MKSVLSLTLIVCLLKSALPATAQEQTERTGPLAKAVTREAVRLAAAAQIERSDDWDTVRRLKDGTRVLVTTIQGRDINGKLATASDDTLRMVVRWGREQMVRRDDIREVRLGHRLSVGQHAGLGLLLGGVTGFLVGAPCSDCPVNVGLAYGTFLGGIGGFVVGEAVHTRSGRLVYARVTP